MSKHYLPVVLRTRAVKTRMVKIVLSKRYPAVTELGPLKPFFMKELDLPNENRKASQIIVCLCDCDKIIPSGKDIEYNLWGKAIFDVLDQMPFLLFTENRWPVWWLPKTNAKYSSFSMMTRGVPRCNWLSANSELYMIFIFRILCSFPFNCGRRWHR